MKSFSKIATVAAVTGVSLVALTAAPVFADGTGQLEGGTIFYQVKDLTQNTAYSDSTSANACDELEYSIELHNTGYEPVNDINVVATLPSASSSSNTSTATATYTNGVVPSTSSNVTVNLASAESISYEPGTTKLYDGNGNLLETLGDGITGSGVNVGNLNGSTTEYLNFKAKVGCPTPPPPASPVYTCDSLGLTAEDNRTVKVSAFTTTASNGATFKDAVINWGDNSNQLTTANAVGQTHQYAADGTYTVAATAHFTVNGQDVTAGGVQCEQQVTFSSTKPPVVTPPTTPTPSQPAPTALVNTGPGSVIGLFGATSAIGAVGYRWLLSRRLSRQ